MSLASSSRFERARSLRGLAFSITAVAGLFFSVTSCLSSGGGGGEGSKEECSPGEEGCECYRNGTCDEGLSCLSKVCVDTGSGPNSGGKTESGDSGPNDEDDDVEATEPGATESGTDEPRPGPSPEPGPASEDDDEDPPDGSETDEGPVEPAPSGPEPSPNPQPTSSGPEPSPTPTEPAPTGPSPTAPSPNPVPVDTCEPSGSCVNGTGLDCEDGEHIARECGGCDLLFSCTSCCNHLGFFAAYSRDASFILQPELVTSFEQSSAAATLAVQFSGSYQLGAVVFDLETSYPIDPNYLEFDLAVSGNVEVSVTLQDGSSADNSGCLYEMEEWDPGVWIPYYAVGCWGEFTTLGYVPATRSIVVRVGTGPTTTARAATLSVYGVRW